MARTVKGKGLPSLEDKVESHSLGAPWTQSEWRERVAELERNRKNVDREVDAAGPEARATS